jgi:HK97 family phage major capsid protein
MKKNIMPTAAESKAKFYHSALHGDYSAARKMAALGGFPADESGLPRNMAIELLTIPNVMNPLKTVQTVSLEQGLEVPILQLDIQGLSQADTIGEEAAKEIEAAAGLIVFKRHRRKIFISVSDTIFHGSSGNLVETIEQNLHSGIAINEQYYTFKTKAAKDDTDHQSFYLNDIKECKAATLRAAIAAALADLPPYFRQNASIVMSSVDWYDLWKDNTSGCGGCAGLYEEFPIFLYGKRVVLVEQAIHPIVGDFRFSHLNYDIVSLFDRDKDTAKGIYTFVLSTWSDHRITLKSAFRIAKINDL